MKRSADLYLQDIRTAKEDIAALKASIKKLKN